MTNQARSQIPVSFLSKPKQSHLKIEFSKTADSFIQLLYTYISLTFNQFDIFSFNNIIPVYSCLLERIQRSTERSCTRQSNHVDLDT